jgi:hypothetical protein
MGRDIRDGSCPTCDHDEIIEAYPYERGPRAFEALAVTHDRVQMFGVAGFDPASPRGRLRIYVCRRCGFAQWFADDPQGIPIGNEYLTRIIKRSSGQGGPYR